MTLFLEQSELKIVEESTSIEVLNSKFVTVNRGYFAF